MFLDNTSHQPEPVAVARIYPQDLKLNKLHSANLPKLPSIAQPFHLLPNNATPRQKNLRQEILYPAQDKPTFHVDEAASSRGPKVLSKNLPDVFLSNLGNKAGKISGLRSRNRDPDRDSSTFVMSRDQICNTEPDAEIKHDDSPIQMKYGKITYRPKDRSPKKLYGKQAHLNLLINPADMPERLSTDESPTNQTLSSFNEIPIARLKSIEDTLRSDRDQVFKGDTLPTITDRISPGLNGGLNSMNFNNAAAAKLENNSNLIRIEQKVNYAQNPVHPRQGKQMSDMSLDMIRKPAAVNFKKNIVMEARDSASHSFHDVIKPIQMRDNVLLKANTKEIKDNKSYNASVSPRNVDFANNAQMNVIDPASAGAKLSLPDTQRQNKKTFIFKKIVGKSNKSDALELSNRKISVRGKERIYRQQTIPSIHLSELITLRKINETLGNNKMKRMLHAPSLKLFDLHVNVESITELNPKESMYIKEKLNEWKNSFISSRYLQRVHSCYWNSPEGCVSILLEPSKSGFLNGVISQYNSLPERCIQTLAKDVLQGLSEVHAITRKAHGNIALNEVIIGSQGHFKLSPGISQMFTSFLNTNKSSPFIDDGFLTVIQKSPKSGSLVKETLSQDIFDYGYLLLQSAIGDFSLYDPSHILTLDNIKKALESEKPTKHSSTVCCCLLHSEDIVRKIIERSAKKPKHMLVKHRSAPDNSSQASFKAIGKLDPEISSPSMYIPLLEVLTTGNHFSKAFIDFLCSCLKLDDFLRANSQSLSAHPFLDEDHISNGADISMKEILKILKKKDNSKTIQENLSESHLERFTESLGVAFLNKEVQEKFERVIKEESARKVEDKKIVDLANELDVSPKKLWDHINLCVSKLETDP